MWKLNSFKWFESDTKFKVSRPYEYLLLWISDEEPTCYKENVT